MRKSCTLRIAFVISGGATVQPTRQPVTAYVFDIPFIVTVRSRMPSSEAIETCLVPSYKMCS